MGRMSEKMSIQNSFVWKFFVAYFTMVRLLSGMDAKMFV